MELETWNIKPNKFLGQNFLKSKKIAEEIIKAADLSLDDVVLEVGPGKGFLTEELIKTGAKIIAVEKDKNLAEFLKEKFTGVKNLEIINADILKFKSANWRIKFKIVANIPYYITSHFLRKFLESDPPAGGQPSLMVLMLQKEVAERIVSKKESLLSISVKVYGSPKIIRRVKAGNFEPKPKVDSAILKISDISKNFFEELRIRKSVSFITDNKGNDTETRFPDSLEKNFFSVVKNGFSSKRKQLKNNLKLLDIGSLTKCGISEKARAEDLSPENWKCLYQNLYK